MTGMSQGHVTNVLRRRRPLSLDRADDILFHLNADVRDFIKTEELLESLQARRLGASPPKVTDESLEPPDQPTHRSCGHAEAFGNVLTNVALSAGTGVAGFEAGAAVSFRRRRSGA